MTTRSEIQEFYNEFTRYELKAGINLRHYHLFNEIISSGLKRHHRILEIGCGVGQLTSLLHTYLRKGRIVATDISNVSLEAARKRIGPATNVDFVLTDMTDFTGEGFFDFIILPDVLEHIPVEHHSLLFGTLSRLMKDESQIFIHIPHPHNIDYYRKTNPSVLQIIDQALHADTLMQAAYPHGLELTAYQPYALFHHQPDYIVIKFKKRNPVTYAQLSKLTIIRKKAMERIRYMFTLNTPF